MFPSPSMAARPPFGYPGQAQYFGNGSDGKMPYALTFTGKKFLHRVNLIMTEKFQTRYSYKSTKIFKVDVLDFFSKVRAKGNFE